MAAKVATLCPPLRGGRSLHRDPWREGHRAGQEAGAGGIAEPGSGEETEHSSPTGYDRHPEDRGLNPHVRRVEPHGCQLAHV